MLDRNPFTIVAALAMLACALGSRELVSPSRVGLMALILFAALALDWAQAKATAYLEAHHRPY